MKIAMVHDCAFVGYELRKELTRRGFEVKQLDFRGQHAKIATLKMAYSLRKADCDIIHAHFARSSIYASYLSGKSYIAHCHGTDIRWGMNWLQKKCLKNAEKVLVSTPDLLEILPNATWLPNPTDVERFKPLKKHDENKLLYFPRWYEDHSDVLKEMCAKLGYDLTIQKFYSVPYEEMHLFLNQFDIFIDRLLIEAYSKTAIEAMACGIPTIGWEHDLNYLEQMKDMEKRRRLAEAQRNYVLKIHDSRKVTKKLISIYEEVKK